MKKILTAQQLKELDEYTIRHEEIQSIDLMERAAASIARAIMLRWGRQTNVVVFAGAGGNGGDALAVARLLKQENYNVHTYLFNPKEQLTPDCQRNKERLQALDKEALTEITQQFEVPALEEDMLVVDGLFGTGLNHPLTGGFASLVKLLNASAAQVVSIDIPSGLMPEDNTHNVAAHIVRANLTLTFQLPKFAMLLAENQQYIGRLQILDIGLSQEKLNAMAPMAEIIEDSDITPLLQSRDPFGHKGSFGHALLIAGKYGMAGAAALSAKACLRSGVGKVTIHTPQRNNDILQTLVPEAILHHDEHPEYFSTPIVEMEGYDAVGIGPGIGTDNATAIAFVEQLRRTQTPLVIDADGLNILAGHKGWLQQVPKETILTPHPGEFRRIGLRCEDDYSTLQEAAEMARRLHIYIVLKGHHTAICPPEGPISFYCNGNSGMATAGSGDALTGIITALLAQGYKGGEACMLGVCLHALAGNAAASRLGEYSLTASDIIDALPEAFQTLTNSQ